MATPNGRGGWDLTDEDIAEIFAVNWGTTPDGDDTRIDIGGGMVVPLHELTDPDREDDRG